MNKRRLALRLLSLLIAMGMVLILTSAAVFYVYVKPEKYVSTVTPEDYRLEYENVTFTASDGIELKGWFIPTNSDDPDAQTLVVLHGYPTDKSNVLPISTYLLDDYNLFLFDFRAMGESSGDYSTLGALEVRDLEAALDYLEEERGVDRVGVWGFSYGGAIAIMTAAQDSRITAIVSDASYATLRDMLDEVYTIPLLKVPLRFLTTLWAQLLLGVDVDDVAPAESARTLTIPLLIIHSREDSQIPFEQAEKLQSALSENPSAEFLFLEDGGHGGFTQEVRDAVLAFFGENL